MAAFTRADGYDSVIFLKLQNLVSCYFNQGYNYQKEWTIIVKIVSSQQSKKFLKDQISLTDF